MTSARNVTRISGRAHILTVRLRFEDVEPFLKIPISLFFLLMLGLSLSRVDLRFRFFFTESLARRCDRLANAIEKYGVGLLLPLHGLGL